MLEKISAYVEEILKEDPAYFLVETKVKPTNNYKVYIDGDKGVAIDKCIKVNRQLYALIEEAAIFPDGDFSLEVSSPGLDKPLKLVRQYIKNIGRNLEITFLDEAKEMVEGKLLDANDASLTLEITTGKGKKAVVTQVQIPYSEIKEAVVQIQF